jgi:hypothetical protein
MNDVRPLFEPESNRAAAAELRHTAERLRRGRLRALPAWIEARREELRAAAQERELTIEEHLEGGTLQIVELTARIGDKLDFKTRRDFEELERQRALNAPLPEGVARFRPRGDA